MWCEVIPGEFALFLLLEEHSRNDSRCNHKRKHLEEEEACCPEHVADVKNKEESQCWVNKQEVILNSDKKNNNNIWKPEDYSGLKSKR